jgi:hypothetical protein
LLRPLEDGVTLRRRLTEMPPLLHSPRSDTALPAKESDPRRCLAPETFIEMLRRMRHNAVHSKARPVSVGLSTDSCGAGFAARGLILHGRGLSGPS